MAGTHAQRAWVPAPPRDWDAVAGRYDEMVTATVAPVARQALARAGLRPGDRFLDVAAGPGSLGLSAARLGARVLATDWSPAMIGRFRAHVRAEGFRRSDGEVMDAHALRLPDGAFDVTGSQFGVMLAGDPEAALSEMARVTRRGGRVLVVTYGPLALDQTAEVFAAALSALRPDLIDLVRERPRPQERMADPGALRAYLGRAGLREPEVHTDVELRLRGVSGSHLWEWVVGTDPFAGALADALSPSERATLIEVLHGMLRERTARVGSADLTAPINVGVATA